MPAIVTVCMAVYGQPLMLERNLSVMQRYDEKVKSKIKVIVVDDHGDPPVLPGVAVAARNEGLEVDIYRIDDDIAWNQMGARNLAMHQAPPTWCLMIDPDMVFSEAMMRRVLSQATKLRRGIFLRYGLFHFDKPTAGIDRSSPNTYLIHRDDFLAAGGYDEDYRGHKGWSDVQMLDVLREHHAQVQASDIYASFYSTSVVPDAAVYSLDRRTAQNKKKRIKKVQQARKAGGWRRWVKKRKGRNLRFSWHKVYPTA